MENFNSKKLAAFAWISGLVSLLLQSNVPFNKLAVVTITLGVVACVYLLSQTKIDRDLLKD